MTARPRLLFLCHTLPYPLDGGVWIRTFHVLRLLATAFDVHALCFERSGVSGTRYDRDVAASRDVLRRTVGPRGEVEVFALPQNRSQARYAWNHARSLLAQRVYTRFMYASPAYQRRLRELVTSGGFALVHADSLDLSAYLPLCEGLPVACTHHNVESELLRRRARFEGGRLAPYYALQARWMANEEHAWGSRVAMNVMVSDEDRALFERLVPGARTTVVPNGVDVEEFRPEPGKEEGVVYVGGTNWFPNVDALDFFCEDVLPRLREAEPDLPVRWVGSASPEEQRRYRERFGVELTGYVEDVRPYMRDALCHVVPLRAGGGTRLKILNSWAMGKPVVSTSVGCEGLGAADGENLLVRDDPAAFAEAIVSLARDASLRARLGAGARRTAEEIYGWDVIGRGLIGTYQELAGTAG